jgi:hypothetical protein
LYPPKYCGQTAVLSSLSAELIAAVNVGEALGNVQEQSHEQLTFRQYLVSGMATFTRYNLKKGDNVARAKTAILTPIS